jgi:hypothetical protein
MILTAWFTEQQHGKESGKQYCNAIHSARLLYARGNTGRRFRAPMSIT